MSENQNNKKNKILFCVVFVLAALYAFSFTKTVTSKDSRKTIKTSLVNPKYKNSINSIELSDSSGSIKLVNNGKFWTVSKDDEEELYKNCLPVSKERIENLIDNLIKVRNMYKISDRISNSSSFGLTSGTEFHLLYNIDSGFHELIFGNQDFALSSRYLMTEKNTQVYETDCSLDNFLTTSIQNWAEPYIISRLVFEGISAKDVQLLIASGTKKDDFNSKSSKFYKKITNAQTFNVLFELRHGGIAVLSQEQKESVLSLVFELGNKNSILLDIFDANTPEETVYIVKSQYKNQSGITEFSSTVKISGWTYNKIKETIL